MVVEVFVVVLVVNVGIVVSCFVVVIIVGPRNLSLKFSRNWVNYNYS